MSAKRRSSPRTEENGESEIATPQKENNFLIVAVGASAGGIEALTDLLRNLPPDTGMAFVLIQHLDPTHHSILTELLARESSMEVEEVQDGMHVQPNHVYVIPPNASMHISDHLLHIGPRTESRGGLHMSIDQFMRSLAESHGNRAIGVLLSGSGTDGTLGMAEIQAQGGVTFAQDDATAKYQGMPRSAIVAGYVDHVLPPKSIARELARISMHPYAARPNGDESESSLSDTAGLNAIFHLLRRATGVDFAHYRKTTILRRIQRRMVVHKINNLSDYVKYVQTSTQEIKALYQDMLINVTSFFRNPEVFDALKTRFFKHMAEKLQQDRTLRIWVPACASGEEAYSLAIALLENLGNQSAQTQVQLFGTDVSEMSIAKARNGIYPENIQADVSPERLKKFFTKAEGGYRISKNIRDICIFAPHNVLSDPPFSRMDLVCCRNLLIYLEPVLQAKVISLFYYALNPEGLLILGTSEGVGAATNLFNVEDRLLKIFSKKTSAARHLISFSLANPVRGGEPAPRTPVRHSEAGWMQLEAQKEFDRHLLSQFSPPTVFVNNDLEIIHTRGNVSRYLKLASGRASLSILKMAREGLMLELRSALNKAKRDGVTVKKQRIPVKIKDGDEKGSERALVNIEIVPVNVSSAKESYYMVLFQEAGAGAGRRGQSRTKTRIVQQSSAKDIARLEQELAATKEYLQSIIETHEATNEELQSANEEIISSNEELQSTNEELETAKEELQSTNEELSTVNDELRNRNQEISEINRDLTSLLSVIDIAVVIIRGDLTIRRFTPLAQQIFGLISGDIGRPLTNINPTLDIPDFHVLVLQVVSDSKPMEREVKDKNGASYLLKIFPYPAAEERPDGAVIMAVPKT